MTQALTPDDDCQCEMCKNGELLLEAIKLQFSKAEQQELVDDVPYEPLALVELGVCSSKNCPCSVKNALERLQSPACVNSYKS